MSTDESWESWWRDFERARETGAAKELAATLESFWRVRLGAGQGERWERLFRALLPLLDSDDERLRALAHSCAMTVVRNELGPPYRAHTETDRQRQLVARIDSLLPRQLSRIGREPTWLLDFLDELVAQEELAGLGPRPEIVAWVASLSVPTPLKRAGAIVYEDGRQPWVVARPLLLDALDDDDVLVRAAAARAIGARYHAATNPRAREPEASTLAPPFAEVVRLVTQKELARPGIAGPLFSSWYGLDTTRFEQAAEVSAEEWVLRILRERSGAEPSTLPISVGIDFFAHELFSTHPSYIRALLELGRKGLALAAATEVPARVDGLEPILRELGASEDDETCRLAAWHLAYHYRVLHPEGVRRGFVRRGKSDADVELFLHLGGEAHRSSCPYAATLYPRGPRGDETFTEEDAWRHLDALLPPSVRGELVVYGMPGDGGTPGMQLIRNGAHGRFARGARVRFTLARPVTVRRWKYVDEADKRYSSVSVIWHGGPEEWRVDA